MGAGFLGAFFLLVGVGALRGFMPALLAFVFSAAVFFTAPIHHLPPWPLIYVVLIVFMIRGTKPPATLAEPEEREKRRAFMESQEKRANQLFRQASASGEFIRPPEDEG